MSQLFDKRGIPFQRGDVVKVFHFTGARRKRHYMYHHCLGTTSIGPSGRQYYLFSHLNFIEDRHHTDGPYPVLPEGQILPDYEIVQSIDCKFEERPRTPNTGGSSDGR